MCEFFSFLLTRDGEILYHTPAHRRRMKGEDQAHHDSHSVIWRTHKKSACALSSAANKYEYNPFTGDFDVDTQEFETLADGRDANAVAERWVRRFDLAPILSCYFPKASAKLIVSRKHGRRFRVPRFPSPKEKLARKDMITLMRAIDACDTVNLDNVVMGGRIPVSSLIPHHPFTRSWVDKLWAWYCLRGKLTAVQRRVVAALDLGYDPSRSEHMETDAGTVLYLQPIERGYASIPRNRVAKTLRNRKRK